MFSVLTDTGIHLFILFWFYSGGITGSYAGSWPWLAGFWPRPGTGSGPWSTWSWPSCPSSPWSIVCLAVSLPDVVSDGLRYVVVHVHQLLRVPKDEAKTCAYNIDFYTSLVLYSNTFVKQLWQSIKQFLKTITISAS